VADVFARDEQMLCGWATAMPYSILEMMLDAWRMHADHDRVSATARKCFDSHSLHLSSLLDGMGQVDGPLDSEGFVLEREALRQLTLPECAQRQSTGGQTSKHKNAAATPLSESFVRCLLNIGEK
jgi:hypothetical protein